MLPRVFLIITLFFSSAMHAFTIQNYLVTPIYLNVSDKIEGDCQTETSELNINIQPGSQTEVANEMAAYICVFVNLSPQDASGSKLYRFPKVNNNSGCTVLAHYYPGPMHQAVVNLKGTCY